MHEGREIRSSYQIMKHDIFYRELYNISEGWTHVGNRNVLQIFRNVMHIILILYFKEESFT